MAEMRVFSYIKKYRRAIIIVSLLLGAVFYMYFSRKQSYTAQAVIRYTNEEAAQGLAPDGTEIDTSEIYSSEVMTKVFQKMGLNYDKNNMDAVRSGINVEPVLTDEEKAVQEALNEKGETSLEKPTMYKVSYKIKKKEAKNAEKFASDILTAMLGVYEETYAKNHVNKNVTPNAISGIYDKDYDYIEMIELLEQSIDKVLDNLQYKTDIKFRSADTGYSFEDLYGEFKLLKNINVSNIYAYILGNRVTKDQDVLISKYENRIKNATLNNQSSQSEIGGIDEIIASYVRMMRESGNVNVTYEYILGELYDNYFKYIDKELGIEKFKEAEITTEYDDLMNNFIKERTNFEHTLIDIAYDRYILDIYTGTVSTMEDVTVHVIDEQAGAAEVAGQVASQAAGAGRTGQENPAAGAGGTQLGFDTNTVVQSPVVSSEAEKDTAYQMVKELTDRLDSLYNSLQTTNEEYNRFAGAENISVVTDTITTEKLNLLVYAMLSVVLFGVLGCMAAVVLGRLGEILDYYAYTDKKLNIANRAGCDRYIAKYADRLLPPGVVCIVINIPDVEGKNRMFGREKCDVMLKDLCDILRQTLPSENTFMAVNSLGQFVLFLNNVDKEYAYVYVNEIHSKCAEYNKLKNCKIAYVCGISSSDADGIYDMKKLMVDAIKKATAKKI